MSRSEASIESSINQLRLQQGSVEQLVASLQNAIKERDATIEQLTAKHFRETQKNRNLYEEKEKIAEQLQQITVQYQQLHQHCSSLLTAAKQKNDEMSTEVVKWKEEATTSQLKKTQDENNIQRLTTQLQETLQEITHTHSKYNEASKELKTSKVLEAKAASRAVQAEQVVLLVIDQLLRTRNLLYLSVQALESIQRSAAQLMGPSSLTDQWIEENRNLKNIQKLLEDMIQLAKKELPVNRPILSIVRSKRDA